MASPITERITTQFRVEMFNIFNRRNLPVPNGNFSSGSFGRISDTIGDYNGATGIGAGEPFNVQLALKLFIAPPFLFMPYSFDSSCSNGGQLNLRFSNAYDLRIIHPLALRQDR